MADELKQPGIEVLQVFEEVTPAVIVPTLGACPIGKCVQVVEVLESDGAGGQQLNSDAAVAVPAFFESKAAQSWPFADFDGKTLYFEINNGPPVPVLFTASANLSAKKIAGALNDAFIANNVYASVYAEAVLTDGTTDPKTYKLRVRTRAGGNLQNIKVYVTSVADRSILTSLGVPEGKTFTGLSAYEQSLVKVPTFAFPDPRGNLDDLVFDKETIRAFMYMGTGLSLQEGFQNQALLRYGDTAGILFDCTDIKVIDDGNGDTLSPIIELTGEDLTAASAAIVATGAAAGAGPYALTGLTIALDFGQGMQEYTFIEDPVDMAAVATLLDDIFGAAAGGKLSFAAVGALLDELEITTTDTGADAYLHIGDSTTIGTAHTILGLTAAALDNKVYRGDKQDSSGTALDTQPHPVKPGDELYLDGIFAGTVVKVDPTGTSTAQVRVDQQHAITATGYAATYYIVAKNLPPPNVSYDRPDADGIVDDNTGDVTIKHSLVRQTTGYATDPVSAPVYVLYEALRRDVAPLGVKPSLLQIDNTNQLEALLEPINPANPLALGFYFALLNASGSRVYGMGVDEYSDDEPWGTSDAFQRVFSFLESKEVYGIAPLTDDIVVAQLGNIHALNMADPEMKGERVCVVSLPRPTRDVDVVVASGTRGNSGNQAAPNTLFYTSVSNLSALLLAKGIDPASTIPVDSGVFLDIEDDAGIYSVKQVIGGAVLVRQTAGEFAPGENDDGFYTETGYPVGTPFINASFSIKVRGAELVDLNGDPDADKIANAYQDIGKSFGSRRLWNLVVDNLYAPFDGVDQVLPGFYAAAAYVGLISGQPPQQSFTNFPIVGFTRIDGTNDYFGTRQLDRIAAGGNTIIVQDPPDNGPIFPRMALTTDLSSIETRTDSITKVLDFSAKTIRVGLRNFIGKFNITQSYLDTLSTVLQGLIEFLISNNVLVDAEINNLIQDEDTPDTVLVDITVDVPYPCNYIRVRLIV